MKKTILALSALTLVSNAFGFGVKGGEVSAKTKFELGKTAKTSETTLEGKLNLTHGFTLGSEAVVKSNFNDWGATLGNNALTLDSIKAYVDYKDTYKTFTPHVKATISKADIAADTRFVKSDFLLGLEGKVNDVTLGTEANLVLNGYKPSDASLRGYLNTEVNGFKFNGDVKFLQVLESEELEADSATKKGRSFEGKKVLDEKPVFDAAAYQVYGKDAEKVLLSGLETGADLSYSKDGFTAKLEAGTNHYISYNLTKDGALKDASVVMHKSLTYVKPSLTYTKDIFTGKAGLGYVGLLNVTTTQAGATYLDDLKASEVSLTNILKPEVSLELNKTFNEYVKASSKLSWDGKYSIGLTSTSDSRNTNKPVTVVNENTNGGWTAENTVKLSGKLDITPVKEVVVSPELEYKLVLAGLTTVTHEHFFTPALTVAYTPIEKLVLTAKTSGEIKVDHVSETVAKVELSAKYAW